MTIRKEMIIRQAQYSDLDCMLSVERTAFDSEEEANLVHELLDDASAEPIVSLLAFQEDLAVGHILFTKARLEPESAFSISILAPLAVIPDAQNQGIGGKLIKHGLQVLLKSGVDLVFVLGYPAYYSRYGFQPAKKLGLDTPYSIPEEHADAWMVQALRPGVIGAISGKVICADKLQNPKYWRE